MSGRRSKKNQRLGSSRRGPKGLNRNIENDDDDDGFQQIAESGDGKNEFHTTSDYHSAQFDHPPSSSIDQQTSALECPPHASSHKDSLVETELPVGKRKMGSTRKSAGGFKVERKLDELRTTEELDEYVSQPNISPTEEQHSSFRGDEQSRSSSFPSNLSLNTESSGLGGEHRVSTLMDVVSENEEKDAIHHQEITSHSYEVVSATVSESDLLREDPVMFNKLKPLSRQDTPLASTTGQKRRMGSTRRPLGGKNSENVGLQEHLRSMTDNERKAEVIDEAKFSMSEEMAQMWDDVLRDDPSSHTETSLVSNQSLLAERAELKEPDVSAGTETRHQSVAFPLVNPEKPLPETSSHNETPLLNKGLDFKFGSHTEDFNVLNKVLEDDNQHVPGTRNDTNTFHDCRDVNTAEGKEEFLTQKEEPQRNKKTSSLSPIHDAQLEELVLNCEESPSLSPHTAQFIEGGNVSFDVLVSNISNAQPTATNSPDEMSDAVEESQEIYVEMKHKNNLCDAASITCETLTDLECADEDERGSETDNGFEITDQGDARDHNVTQIIMESRNNKEDGGTSTETVSHQESCEVSNEKEELHREREYSSTISQIPSGPPQDNAGKMLENKEVREDKGETENTIVIDVTSKPEEMLSFEDSATDTGPHAHQQLFMQSPGREIYDLSEKLENVAFNGRVGRSEETEGIEGMDASLLILEVEKPITNVNTVYNDSESDLQTENPDQNRVLTEEQNDTSPFQVSDNVSAVIDSSPLLRVALGSEETDNIAEESDISLVLPEDSQDSYKLTTFHSETQFNEGDAEIVPVGGDADLEIQAEIKSFYSFTGEAVETEKNSHDVSVLVREFDINGDTVTVESNRTTKSDFPQTSSEALKVSENPENEVSSDINIPEDSHREEAHTKSSPVVYKRKMGSTRRPLRGDKGQRKRTEYHDENETFNSESMINVEKETFRLEDEPSPDESSYQSSKEEAKEQEMDICEKNDVAPAEGSESDLMQSSFSLDSVSEESTAVTISHITESQTLTNIYEESQDNTEDAERLPAEGDAESHSEIQTENKTTDLTTSEAERTEENIPDATVIVREVEFTVDTVTVESNMSESDLLQNYTFTDVKLEVLRVSENAENVFSVTDTGLLVQDDVTEGSGETDTIPDRNDTSIIPEDSPSVEASHSKPNPIVHKRKMGSTRRPLKEDKGQRKGIKYNDENETLEPSPDESLFQSSKDGAKEQGMELREKKDFGPESDLMQSSFSLDSVSEESTAVTLSHITESQTLTKMNQESQDNTEDAERLPAEGDAESHSEIQTENKTTDLTTSEAERTEENIPDATVLVRDVEFTVDKVTVESNMSESDLLQKDTFTDAKLEALRVSENTENVFSLTDTGLLVQDDVTEESRETDTIPDRNDTSIIPEDSHSEEASQSKPSPIVHKRKMGSTRRPLKGNEGQRKGIKYNDENETIEPSPDESMLQSSKDGAKEQEIELCEKKDVGPESDLMQSSFSLDSVSEESTAVTLSHITESQTLTKMNQESQKNSGNPERMPAEGDAESHSEMQTENKTTDLTTSEAERTEENIPDATVIVKEVEVTGDTVSVDSDMTTESDFHQNASSPDVNMEALKVSENIEKEVSGETDTILKHSETNIIPEDTHREETCSKLSPIVHKRKMGSTRRPLKGDKGQRKEKEHYDENEKSHDEREIFVLEDEPSPDNSRSQSSKDGAKEQMEISEKNDVAPAEGSESDLMQSSFSLDSVSEESTAVTLSHITESQTLTKINQESQKNSGNPKRIPTEGDAESHSEIQTENKTTDLTTSEAERTEENIPDATVLVGEVEFTVDTVTVESNMSESDLLQNDTFTDAKLETLRVSENTENVFSVTDTGLLVQDDVTEESRETDTIPDRNDTSIIPEDSHSEEASHSKPNPIVHKRKMGSTRRPLKGDKGQRKGIKYNDENETLEPSPDESLFQRSKDGAKEQGMELREKKDVGPESDLMQSSFSLDSVSEESTAVTLSHITESQTLTKMNQESQDNTEDAERLPAEGDAESHSEIQTENKTTDLTTSEAERTEENIPDATVLVRDVEFTVDTVTVESNMSESDLLQKDIFTDAKLEALRVSENTEKVFSVTDTGLLVEDDVTEESRETDTIPDRNDTSIIPEDSHSEEASQSKPSPIVHKRKMGSTRRPLKGNEGQRKGIKYNDENETLEPSPDESLLQSSKDGAIKQEMELCEKKDVGSESDLMQSSFSLDSVSAESTAVTLSHITESQTLTNMNQESQKNSGNPLKMPAEGDAESHSEMQTENKTTDLTSEAEGTEENICEATVLVKEVEVTGDVVTVESNMTTESDFHQNASSPDAHVEDLKVSENVEHIVSGEKDTITEPGDINIIPEESHREEVHTKSSPIVHKRKMGSTRRPLREDKGQRKEKEHYDENEKPHDEREIFVLEDAPSPDESSLQSSKEEAKEQETEISEKNDVAPAEGSESDLMQSSFSLDSVSEESTAVTLSHITESQTLTKINQESQKNSGNPERMPAEGDAESHSEMQTENKTTEALRVSGNTENVFSVTDTGLLVQDDVTEESRETDTIPDRNYTSIIPEDSHSEEASQSKPSPIVHKRKMGSTRRPLKGDKGQRKGIKYNDENETLEPSPDESTLQSSKDGAIKQEMELREKKDVGPESDLMQSSFSLDSVSEESTAVTLSHITESQTLTNIYEESQDNTGDADKAAVGGDSELCIEIKAHNQSFDSTTCEAEETEDNSLDASVSVRGEDDVIGNTVTVERGMTTESVFLQSSPDVNMEALKVSENIEKEVSGETDTIPDRNDTNIIPDDTHRETAHSKPNPIVHKRKMGSTRRPLKGNKGQRKEKEHYDENKKHHDEREIFVLEDEPSPDESSLQSSKEEAKEQEMEISEKNDVSPPEGSESDLMQSSFSLDSVSEESTAVTLSHITESQTLTKMNQESQDNTEDAERLPAEGDAESHSEIQTENKTTDLTTSEAERTEENIPDATVIVREVEFTVDTVTVESNMSESDLLQNDTFTDAKLETLRVSENTENVFSVTDTGRLVQDDVTEESRETDTIPDRNDTSIIPEDSYSEEASQSKPNPIVHKRKMGSTRRPLKGNKGQRKGIKYDDENETLEPNPDESLLQSSKDGAKEQEIELCEKKDVGPESDLMQSSFSLDSVSEESTAVTLSHITESQTLTNMNQESQKNSGNPERMPAEGDAESLSKIQTGNKTTDLTSEAERTEENICEATVIVKEVEVTGDTVTVNSDMTTESNFHQNVSSPDAHVEDLKVSENVENIDSGETDTITEPGDINIIPEESHREEVHTKSNPIVHKRKMGSTRRPLKGNKGQRKEKENYDENEKPHDEREIFVLEDEPSPDESSYQSSKDGAKEQEIELCEKKDVGPESDLMQSSFSLDSVSEESTAVTLSHITESQTLTKINQESQKNSAGPKRMPTEGDAESHSEIQTENKTIDLTSETEGTEENICEATVLVREVIRDTVTVVSDMTTESDFHQNASSPDAHVEDLKVSENVENKVSREEPSDINIIPEVFHREEAHAKSSPVVYKRKMGSTRRPLRGDTGQRNRSEYHDENETFSSESMINVEKETFSLEDEPSPFKSTSQSSNDAQKLTDVKLDSLKVSENTEHVSFVTDTGLLVQDDATEVYSNVTTESDFHQNASSPYAHVEELKVSENVESKVSGETDTITELSDINIIPEHSHREEVHAKVSPIVHKRKMGSTRRPLRGNKGQRKGEEDTETLSEIQDQDNVVGHNVTQEICNIRDDEDEERMTTTLVGMSVQLCEDLKQEHRSDVSQTQTGPSQDDTGSLEVPERTADFVRDSLTIHSDLDLSDALPMEETQIHVSSEDVVTGETWVPPTEVVEMHSVSNRSLQKRKMGSSRKRGKRMVNEEEVEEEKEGEAENTTIDDGTTKSEETLILEEDITGSLVHQQAFQQSDVQTKSSEQNDQNQAAEIVSDRPLGDVETYSVPEQSEITSFIPEESHRKDVQSNSIPVVQKRKMGSSRKTLKGNKGQRREVESKKMDGESKGIAKEQDTDSHLAISEGENKWKLDEDVEQNFPVEFSYQAAISNMFSESEDGVKEVSLNIHDPPEVSEEKGLENTVNDSNSLNEPINLYEGTMDKFVLTVSHEDVHQTMSAEYLDQHVDGGSETEQTETTCHVFPSQELKNTQDDVVHENSSQKIPCTKEKRRKISTRRNPRVMHGKDMGDQDDILGMAVKGETKKAEDDLDDMPLASSISQPKEMSSEAVSTTDLESEISVSKGVENDYPNNSDPSGLTGPEPPENTLQICENQLVSADVTKHLQPETVTVGKRKKMGSTRKNVREGGIRGKRDAYEDTETADTHLTISQDSEMSLVGKAVGEQTIHDQSEDSLLSEIERALNKTSQSSSNYELNVNEPNSGDLANTPYLNKPENSQIKSLQPQPSPTSKTNSEPNSPERRRRKMGSTRRNPRQQLKAERQDEDKEDGEVEENSEGKKQEMKNPERVEVSVEHNIPENKLNKEHLNVPSAHTSSSQLEESGNPVVQEKMSPSTKRKFGSRRTNKGKQGLGRLDASDRSELEDEVNDDLAVCDPYHSLNLQQENQPISKSISEQSNMEARNEEAAPKVTGAGLVSLDQIIKHDRGTGTKQTINIQNRNSREQFNVVMVGNSCVGKTSFIRRFHEGQFTEDYRSTIGVDTCVQTVVLPDRTVNLQIWDTAGQERFHSITRQVFNKADGLLLMYEITSSKSFISVRDWISQARERAPDDAIMILLGNKSDSVEREVQIQEGVDLAGEYNIQFMECSAATGANVSESMTTLAELLVQRKTRREEHTTLRREPPPKKSGCC